MKVIMLYVGSMVIILWGIAHIVIPSKGIVQGFGPISIDNKRILTIEWIMEGLALIFIGSLVILVTLLAGVENSASTLVYRSSGVMLGSMAVVSLFTGARTPIIPMKLCPPIFVSVAIAYLLGSM
jgi:hypothetical protein